MKLLFRHTVKSILKAPKESIVILLTVILSAILFATAGELYSSVERESEEKYSASYGAADIAISALSENGTRFVSDAVLNSAVEDIDSTLGLLSLPFSLGGENLSLAGLDLKRVKDIFTLSLIDTEPINQSELPYAVYITKALADSQKLKVGDTVLITVLGTERELRVCGINKTPIFDSCDAILDINCLLRILTESSPAFAVFDEANMPYTTLYISLKDGISPETVAEKINMSDAANNAAAKVISYENNQHVRKLQQVVFITIIICTMIMSCAFVIYSLQILSEKRQKETEAFLLVGVKRRALFGIFSLEALAYIVLGTVTALALSSFLLPMFFSGALTYSDVSLSSAGILTAAFCELLVAAASLLIYRFAKPKRTVKRKSGRIPLTISLSLIIMCAIASVLIPVRYKYIMSAALLFLILFALFSGLPMLLSAIERLFARVTKSATASLALKNNSRMPEMRYLHCAISAILAIAVIPIAAFVFYGNLIDHSESRIDAQYVITGADENLKNDILALEGTEACTSACILNALMKNGETLFLASADDMTAFTDYNNMNDIKAPAGNEIIMPPELADLLEISLGDKVEISLNKGNCEFVLAGYTSPNCRFAYINAADMGFNWQMLLVSGADTDTYIDAITQKSALYGASVSPVISIFHLMTEAFRVFSKLLGVYLSFIFILTLVGCVNLVYVGYAKRRGHFRILTLSGMTRIEKRKMIATEAGALSATVITAGAVCGAVLLLLLDTVLRSYGYSLFFK